MLSLRDVMLLESSTLQNFRQIKTYCLEMSLFPWLAGCEGLYLADCDP